MTVVTIAAVIVFAYLNYLQTSNHWIFHLTCEEVLTEEHYFTNDKSIILFEERIRQCVVWQEHSIND